MYELDGEDRIVRVRDSDPASRPEPPRFALVRTAAGNIPLVRHDLPDAIAGRLLALAAEEPPLADPEAPPRLAAKYAAVLAEDAPVRQTYAGPAFLLPPPERSSDGIVLVDTANAGVLEPHLDWAVDCLALASPIAVVLEEGVAVAACFSARESGPAIEAGVFTVPAYRGRGYATACVAAWAAAVYAAGRLPLYSTSWEKAASRRIAHSLGGRFYGVDFSLG